MTAYPDLSEAPEVSEKVQIVNPLENGSRFTSRTKADQYVHDRRAEFVGENCDGQLLLKFLDWDPRNEKARESAARRYREVSSTRQATDERELIHIPILMSWKMFRRGSAGKNVHP
jgi:hypothetical protein